VDKGQNNDETLEACSACALQYQLASTGRLAMTSRRDASQTRGICRDVKHRGTGVYTLSSTIVSRSFGIASVALCRACWWSLTITSAKMLVL